MLGLFEVLLLLALVGGGLIGWFGMELLHVGYTLLSLALFNVGLALGAFAVYVGWVAL